MDLINHPLVAGPAKRAGLFWFTISPLLTGQARTARRRPLPRTWTAPEIIHKDRTMHALADAENSPPTGSAAINVK